MTDRAEIERLLQMTGRTLEELPNSYPKWKCSDTIRKLPFEWPIEMPVAAGNALLHQSDVIELLIDALRDALDKQPKWINVEDRLPESHEEKADCFLVTDGTFMWMAYYACKEWQFAECTDSPYVIDWTEITHWMPLPEPPKEEPNA